MQDAVDAFESLQRLGAEQAVGVGDDANALPPEMAGGTVAWGSSCRSSHMDRAEPARPQDLYSAARVGSVDLVSCSLKRGVYLPASNPTGLSG